MKYLRCLPILTILSVQVFASSKIDVVPPPWIISPDAGPGPVIFLDSSEEFGPGDDEESFLEDLKDIGFPGEPLPDPRKIEQIAEEKEKEMEREKEEEEEESPSPDKRLYGHVLGGGFKFGKRAGLDRYSIDADKRFGLVLGRGFKFGKRSGESSEEDSDSSNDEDYDEITKRGLGNVLGRGWKFGKRGSSEEEEEAGEDPRFLLSPADKRYGWVFGRRFGKRYHGNRGYGSLLGGGWKFGKRSARNSYVDRLGFLLGRGMNLKREGYDSENDEEIPMDKRFGSLFGRRWNFKRGGSHKRFGFLLGRGLNFKKRSYPMDDESLSSSSESEDDFDPSSAEMDKRYSGRLFGGGFRFKKREYGGFGRGDKKRFGYVIGGGFKFGKRQAGDQESDVSSSEEMDEDKRAVGHILGHGFKFGKREAPFGGEKPIM